MEVRTQEAFDRAAEFVDEMGALWLGGKNINGVWFWDSNEEMIEMGQFWGSGEPYGDPSYHCLAIQLSETSFDDTACNGLYPFVCELN